MVKGVIFDFDGVIVDSEVEYVATVVEYLHRIGIETTFNDVKYIVGQNMDGIASDLIRQFNLDLPVEKVIKDSLEVCDELFDITKLKPMKGLMEFLERCKTKGIRMAIGSSSDYNYLYTILDCIHARDYFDFVLSGTDFVKGKPDPEIYNVAAERMGIDKKDLMVIEDSRNGVMAGVAAGIYTVGLKVSEVTQDTSMADIEVHDFSEIDLGDN